MIKLNVVLRTSVFKTQDNVIESVYLVIKIH